MCDNIIVNTYAKRQCERKVQVVKLYIIFNKCIMAQFINSYQMITILRLVEHFLYDNRKIIFSFYHKKPISTLYIQTASADTTNRFWQIHWQIFISTYSPKCIVQPKFSECWLLHDTINHCMLSVPIYYINTEVQSSTFKGWSNMYFTLAFHMYISLE